MSLLMASRKHARILLVCLMFTTVIAYPSYLGCDSPLAIGSRYMYAETIPGSRAIGLRRAGVALGCSGATVHPGEILEMDFSSTEGQYAVEVVGATIESGVGFPAECGNTRSTELKSVKAPDSGSFVIRAAYASVFGPVSIVPDCPYVVEGGSGERMQAVVEAARCGEIIDSHLHLGAWWSTSAEMNDELSSAHVSRGILYAVYAKVPVVRDPNEEVSEVALGSNGRIVGLASLNTTGDWSKEKGFELSRLRSYLGRPEFVGAKLAPPHTCLALNSAILRDIVTEISKSSKPVLGIHVGTTPFCSMAPALACCAREYVDPSLLENLIDQFRGVTFVLLHSGFDFLPRGDKNYYDGTLVDHAIALAKKYGNVFLEISALHAQDDAGALKYPGGDEAVQKMADAGVVDKVVWGSDGNHKRGQVLRNLEAGIAAMERAGFTPGQRCASLAVLPREVYGMGPRGGGAARGGGGGGSEALGALVMLVATVGLVGWVSVLVVNLGHRKYRFATELKTLPERDSDHDSSLDS